MHKCSAYQGHCASQKNRADVDIGPCKKEQSFAEFSADAENKIESFSVAACMWTKTLLRLQVWNLFGMDEQIVRAADCKKCQKAPRGIFDSLNKPSRMGRLVL